VTPFAGVCLDTDVCIDLLRGTRRLEDISFADLPSSALWVSAITVAELEYGVRRSRTPDRESARLTRLLEFVAIRAFDSRAAGVAGTVRAHLEQGGARIGALDALIGGHALAEGAALLTRNVREFSRIPGLVVAEL